VFVAFAHNHLNDLEFDKSARARFAQLPGASCSMNLVPLSAVHYLNIRGAGLYFLNECLDNVSNRCV